MNTARFRLSVFFTALFGCSAIQMTLGITVRNPLTVVLFVLLYLLGFNIPSLGKFKGFIKEGIPFAVGLGAAFLLRNHISAGLSFESRLFSILASFINFMGYWLVARLAVIYVTEWRVDEQKMRVRDLPSRNDTLAGMVKASDTYDKAFGKRIFIVTSLVCLICYLPYFLYEFPGIMTADSLDQFDQLTGFTPYANHHPIVHTLLIKFFYEIGLRLTHDKIIAISIYTTFQMIFLCLCNGAVVVETLKLVGKKSYRLAILFIVFYALIPFNNVFSVTIWKDVPFACISMLLCVVLAEIYRKGDHVEIIDFFLFMILSILFCMMRSNAWYAYLVFALLFVIKMRKKMLMEAIVSVTLCILAVLIIKGPVFNTYDIPGPDFTESLSVPLQQVARVLVNDRPVDPADIELIDNVIDRTYIHELYAPNFADNIKELVRAGNPQYLESNKGEFLRLWLRLGLKYPRDYIAAWFDLVGGYIYTDVDYRVADVDGIMPNIHGIYPSPIIGGKFIKVKEILIKLQDFMPFYGMLFTCAIYTWALVATFIYALVKKRPLLIHVLMLLLVLTLLIASPMVDFRYIYAVVMTWPIWLVGINKICY